MGRKLQSMIWALAIFTQAMVAMAHLRGPNVCSNRISIRKSYTVSVQQRIHQRYEACCLYIGICWVTCWRYRVMVRYNTKIQYYTTYTTNYRCCDGWTRVRNRCLIPICKPTCLHGDCVRPNTCSCNTGYEGASTGCRTDINECLASNGNCEQLCHNYIGGHSCSCRRGYILYRGRRCRDIDECAISGRTCQCHDPANNPRCTATCQNTIGSYSCSCSSGYRLATAGKCTDINECLHLNGGCSQVCSNTPGSYRCSCHTGYQLQSDGKSCNDINECLTNNGGCDHVCINSIGSFYCQCRPGHLLDNNRRNCSDVNECLSNSHMCQHTCNNNIDGFYCSCNIGYKLNGDNKTCTDIDECNDHQPGTNMIFSKCKQICHNTIGSYTCSCNLGYRISPDGITCHDVDECATESHSCQQTCQNTLGSHQCKCLSGYKLSGDGRSCDDINECLTANGGCDQLCHNFIEGYSCSCRRGYTLYNGTRCLDINECKSSSRLCQCSFPANNPTCSATCQNTIGSYRCSCSSGYRLATAGRCTDMNECLHHNGGCSQQCSNAPGSHRCSCYIGYQLQSDGKNCNDVDECLTNNGGCEHVCINGIGSYQCQCSPGHVLDYNKRTCSDINECTSHPHGCQHICSNYHGGFFCSCRDGYRLNADNKTCTDYDECNDIQPGTNIIFSKCTQKCHNTVGSYTCSCNAGYRLSYDGKTCYDVDECAIGSHGCQQTCSNKLGSYTCFCLSGYQLNADGHSCDDINECLTSNGGCEQLCHNFIEGYSCSCSRGYTLYNGTRCLDLDECAISSRSCECYDHPNNPGCVATCRNTIGSYRCSCSRGYHLAMSGRCTDINECISHTSGCSQLCSNTPGSYRCACQIGYQLQSDGKSCNDINECSTYNGRCDHVCINSIGSFHCQCRAGYMLQNSKRTCSDINECLSHSHGCQHICSNYNGGYLCSCRNGYRLNGDNKTCTDINECNDFLPGTNTIFSSCTQNCHNTIGSYTCSCNAGYRLSYDKKTCIDVDECVTGPHGCQQVCSNTLGGYTCRCYSGYQLNVDGRSCDDVNECLSLNGGCEHLCHNYPGGHSCSCRRGYTLNSGRRCLDVDECSTSSRLCECYDPANNPGCTATCQNTIGSYRCSCSVGYNVLTSGKCMDIDECLHLNGGCSQLCSDTPGSYRCSCNVGYQLQSDGKSCNDINECSRNNGGCEQLCMNSIGSYRCQCGSGHILDYNKRTCSDIDECFSHPHGCQHVCNNYRGGYFCTCHVGYRLNADNKTCTDIDECNDIQPGTSTTFSKCTQMCHNIIGSYICSCNAGYNLQYDGKTCYDFDECLAGSHSCQQMCNNTLGGYNCECSTGYKLKNDGYSCNDLNECLTSNGGCDQMCHNFPGGHRCSCRKGYTLNNGRRCLDIDECTVSSRMCECHDAANNPTCTATCQNTIGSYRCSCSSGYRLAAAGKCTDLNECSFLNGDCDHICSNTPGSHTCSCRVGYHLQNDGKSCIDTDECSTNDAGCEHICVNSIGSFYCQCRTGYVLDYNNRTCSDIDECGSHSHLCEHICNNYRGDFFCSCRAGYQLNADNKTCTDIDECSDIQPGTSTKFSKCTQKCHNTVGSYTCSCNAGYRLSYDGKTCYDYDECTKGTHNCDQTCTNTPGSYVCSCLEGYQLNANGSSCDALSCIHHPPIPNGRGTCFLGKTGDICSFSCYLGFNLTGSSIRQCQKNRTWSGSVPICSRKHCDKLSPPVNSRLKLPCFKHYQALCKWNCTTGYFAVGPTEQTCMASSNNTMYWTNSATRCQEISVCAPNPCKHNGKCEIVKKDKFKCECKDTGYEGSTCEVGVVKLPGFTQLHPGKNYTFTANAKPDNDLRLTITSNDNTLVIIPSTLRFDSVTTHANFQLRGSSTSMKQLSYRLHGTDASTFRRPLDQTIYFIDPTPQLDPIISSTGGLCQGCHNRTMTVRGSPKRSVNLHSTAPWTDQAGKLTTSGVLVMDIDGSTLPASLVGSSIIANNLVNSNLGDFIDKHTNDSSAKAKNLTFEEAGQCVSEKPSTDYLSDVVKVNSVPKTVADGVNRNTPAWINLVPQQTVTTFDTQDYEANILQGQDIKEKHKKCGDALTAIKNNREYYMYSTNQRMLMHVNDEDVDVGSGVPKCLFRSISENQTVIAFPNATKPFKTLESSTGWNVKANGIDFKNTSKGTVYQLFGHFSTEMSSDSTNVKILINGDLSSSVINDTSFSIDGISVTRTVFAAGTISMSVAGSLPGGDEKLNFIGHGNITMALSGNTRFHREVSVIIKKTEVSSRVLSNGTVNLDRGSKLLYRTIIIDTGGQIKEAQNTTRFNNIYSQVLLWSIDTVKTLHAILSQSPALRALIQPIATNLNAAKSTAMRMSLNAKQTMGPSIYQPLVDLKSLINLIERQMQVLWFKHRALNSSVTEADYMSAFEQSANRIKEFCKVPLRRQNISRRIISRSLIGQGKFCFLKLCFGKSNIEIIYGTSSDTLNKQYGIKVTPGRSTAIIAKMEREVTLGGLVSLPKHGAILQVIDTAKVKQGLLNGTINMYGRKTPVTVKYTEDRLEFSALVLLPDGSQCSALANADISKVIYENEIVFKMTVRTESEANIVKKINHSLKDKLLSISKVVRHRIDHLFKAVKIYQVQRNKAIQNVKVKKENYDVRQQELHKLVAKIKRARKENSLLKSRVIREMRIFDSALINYTRGIEQCPPRLCISKCVPGIVRSVCFKERYEYVITPACKMENKTYTQTETNTVVSQMQVLTHHRVTQCSILCAPLTDFFKSSPVNRTRHESLNIAGREEMGLARTKGATSSIQLTAVAPQVVKRSAAKIFQNTGGKSGKLGMQVGTFLPGPTSIVGSIVGGVIISSFGQCAEMCQATFAPQLNYSIKHKVNKGLKSVAVKERVCTDIPMRNKLGHIDEYECLSMYNCSQTLKDGKCLAQNEDCRIIRLIMENKMKRDSRLAPGYAAYQRNSLQLEALEFEKIRMMREVNNSFQSLSAAHKILRKANGTQQEALQELANVNKFLATEIKLSKLAERMGANVISVQNARFSYYHSAGVRAPTVVYLVMDVVQKDGKSYLVSSLYDFGNENQSRVDAVRQIIKAASSKELSRKRRAIDEAKSFDSAISVNEITKNETRNRCKEVEKDLLYLIELTTILRDDISQFQFMQQAIKEDQDIAENHTKSILDVAISSNLCGEDTGCSSQWLSGLYANATAARNETANGTLTWESKRAEMFANIQQFTRTQNFTKCGGVIDCAQLAITSISDTIQYDNSDLSEVARRYIAELQPHFSQIFEDSSLNANQTKDLANKILKAIELSSVRRLFCDPPPVILRDLPSILVVTSKAASSLTVHVESVHKLTFKWMKNGEEIPNSNSKTLLLSNNNDTVNGYYNCEISNKFGKTLSTVTKVEYQEMPQITMQPQGQTTTLRAPNATILLTCNATGAPTPLIAWHFRPFNSSKEITLQGNETMLTINATSSEQSGVYRCSASNKQGKVTSHGARVHVKDSMIAKFSTGVSFIVVLKTSSNFTNINRTGNNITEGINFNHNSTVNRTLPNHLSANNTKGLHDLLSRQMNITNKRIQKIIYVKHTDTRASISFEIAMQNMDLTLKEHNDWRKMSEDMVMARKGLLILPVWLYTLYNNISSSLEIGNLNTDVLPETMESTMNEASCPQRFSLNSNGVICESCSAGAMYVHGVGCEQCPIGTYQPEQKMLNCMPCQTNYTTTSIGATEAGDCVPIDIDECALSWPVCNCSDPTNNPRCIATCHNTIGSYNCSCSGGYHLDSSGNCTDTNECLDRNGGCLQSCSNTPGSYKCSCHKGYLLQNDGKNCSDINECTTGNGGCEQMCINNIGSFQCQCSTGYELDQNGKTCTGKTSMSPATENLSTMSPTTENPATKPTGKQNTKTSTIEEHVGVERNPDENLALIISVPIVGFIVLVFIAVFIVVKWRQRKNNANHKIAQYGFSSAFKFDNPIYAGNMN